MKSKKTVLFDSLFVAPLGRYAQMTLLLMGVKLQAPNSGNMTHFPPMTALDIGCMTEKALRAINFFSEKMHTFS